MRIFIVNLERSLDRKNILEKRCCELGLKVEFIKAIDGKNLSACDIKKMTRSINYAFMPGEIGCALSHQNIYKKMIEENIPEALILEDDVTLPDNLPELINLLPPSPKEPNVLLLSRVNKYFKSPIKNLGSNFKIHRVQNATTTHSYIINLSAARNLLDALYPVWMTADKWSLFEDYSLLKVEAVIPAPIELGTSALLSTINQKKGDKKINKTKKEIWGTLMKKRPLMVKIKHRIRRGLTPLFNPITDQGKGG